MSEVGQEQQQQPRERRKNIVLCSDGTGQTGARVGGTNVWKIKMAVNRHDHLTDRTLRRQIVFYDAGVGTSALSITRMLGAAFGYGLGANIRQLYKDLAKTYKEGDRIYIFGFSRGAFTARSLAGMISEVGVIEGWPEPDRPPRDNEELEELVDKAYKAYRAAPGKDFDFPRKPSRPIQKFQDECARREITIRNAPIHFVGVFDTVDAYGMPVDELRDWIYGFLNWLRRPHNDGLTGEMSYAYQAIAIDEDRRTFAPTLYDEKRAAECGVTCEQVWFAGAHSNVGGGYPRQGLSDAALYWMMTKAEQARGTGERGLRFDERYRRDVHRDMDGHSTLYDQRSGAGVIWRYLPRDLGKLCQEASTPARIHVSAMDRVQLATADYAPITLPEEFEVVGTEKEDEEDVARFNKCIEATRERRKKAIGPAWSEINKRRWDYRIFLTALLLVVLLVGWLTFGGEDAVETYRKFSVLHKVRVWILDTVPGIKGPAKTLWSWAERGALAFSPGLAERPVRALFKLPEAVFAILLVACILLLRKKKRTAKLRHLGIDLWRGCFQR